MLGSTPPLRRLALEHNVAPLRLFSRRSLQRAPTTRPQRAAIGVCLVRPSEQRFRWSLRALRIFNPRRRQVFGDELHSRAATGSHHPQVHSRPSTALFIPSDHPSRAASTAMHGKAASHHLPARRLLRSRSSSKLLNCGLGRTKPVAKWHTYEDAVAARCRRCAQPLLTLRDTRDPST